MIRAIVSAFLGMYALNAVAGDDLGAAQKIASSGMKAQSQRLKVIAQNIANAGTTADSADKLPYQRKIVVINKEMDDNVGAELVKVKTIEKDKSPFEMKYEPYHPAADENGLVKYPNVKLVVENVDSREAQRTFEANLSSYEISRSNQLKIIDSLSK